MRIKTGVSGTRIAIIVLAIAVVCAACAAAPKYVLTAAFPASPLPVRLVAIYPFTFMYENHPWMSYEKTWDEVAAASAAGRFLVLDPTEFTIYQNRPENAFVSSTLAKKASLMKVKPEEIAIMRGRVERRVTEAAAAIFDQQGKRAGHAGTQIELYIVRVEILHPATGAVLVVIEEQVARNPWAETPLWDKNPALTDVHRAISARAVAELAAHTDAAALKPPPAFSYAVNHHGLFRYALPEGVSLDASAKGLDIVEREAIRFARHQYFDHDLSNDRFKLFEALPYGLLVTAVDDPALSAAGLLPGDVLLKINKRRMTGPHKVWRGFRIDSCRKPATFTVRRGAETLKLTYTGGCADQGRTQ